MEWIDVSRPIDAATPVWPGDTPFEYTLAWTIAQSKSVNVGRLTLSTHTGTHVDAPYHYAEDGVRALSLPLTPFIGPALVVRLSATAISLERLQSFDIAGATRLLIRTDAWPLGSPFPRAIPAVDPLLPAWLAGRGIVLLGLDVPSADPFDSKMLPAHHALAKHSIQLLESLHLAHVEQGWYDLIALPLPLRDADASPVRAVLRARGGAASSI